MQALIRVYVDGLVTGYLTSSSGRPLVVRHARDATRFDIVNDDTFKTLSDALVAPERLKPPPARRKFYFEAVAPNHATIKPSTLAADTLGCHQSHVIPDAYKSQLVPKMTRRPFRFFTDVPNKNGG